MPLIQSNINFNIDDIRAMRHGDEYKRHSFKNMFISIAMEIAKRFPFQLTNSIDGGIIEVYENNLMVTSQEKFDKFVQEVNNLIPKDEWTQKIFIDLVKEYL